MNEFINEDAIKAGTAAMEKGYEQFVAMTKSQVEKVFPAAAKSFDEIAAFNKANYEAATKASQAAVKAFETLGKTMATYNQEAFQASVESAQAFFACKTFQDVVELLLHRRELGIGRVAQGNPDEAVGTREVAADLARVDFRELAAVLVSDAGDKHGGR